VSISSRKAARKQFLLLRLISAVAVSRNTLLDSICPASRQMKTAPLLLPFRPSPFSFPPSSRFFFDNNYNPVLTLQEPLLSSFLLRALVLCTCFPCEKNN
jgi:hypothetical protein